MSSPVMLASAADFITWTGVEDVPSNVDTLLRSCSSLVLNATVSAFYDTDDTTRLAVDPKIRQALSDATCIQAAAWQALGIDPLTGGVLVAGVKTSKGIGSARIGFGDVAQAAAARAAAVMGLVPEAVRRLEQDGLTGASQPWTYG